jgi:hypothetical protein
MRRWRASWCATGAFGEPRPGRVHQARTKASSFAVCTILAQVALASGPGGGGGSGRDKGDEHALPNWWNLRLRGD